MKKVIGVALAVAVLVAMLPATASAFDTIGGKGCRPSVLRPCPNQMPPISTGSNNGFHRGGGSSTNGTGTSTHGGGINTRPAPPSVK